MPQPNLHQQILDHPGMPYYRMLLNYNQSKNILAGNSFEVQVLATKLESGELRGNRDYDEWRHLFRDLDNHLIRYLHNFLTAAMTLVEHTRIAMRSPIIVEAHRQRYQTIIDQTFKISPVARFVQDLRNYVLHYGVPETVHVTHFQPEENTKVFLETAPLLEWTNWTPPALKYINDHAPQIRLLDLVREYEQMASRLHTWFVQEFATQYSDQLGGLEALQRKWNEGLVHSEKPPSGAPQAQPPT